VKIPSVLAPFILELNVNDRLRYGVLSIVMITIVWLTLVLSDINSEAYQDFRKRSYALIELESIAEPEEWEERKKSLEIAGQVLEENLWAAATRSQALAAIQTTLRKLSSDSAFDKTTVAVGTPLLLDEALDLYQVRIRVRGSYISDSALLFVARIEDFKPTLSIENMSMLVVPSRTPGHNRFNADILAYFIESSVTSD
jgi:hypothetical protein